MNYGFRSEANAVVGTATPTKSEPNTSIHLALCPHDSALNLAFTAARHAGRGYPRGRRRVPSRPPLPPDAHGRGVEPVAHALVRVRVRVRVRARVRARVRVWVWVWVWVRVRVSGIEAVTARRSGSQRWRAAS